MLQLSPLPGRFCSGSRNPRSSLWLALVSSQRSITSGSDLNNWHISPSGILPGLFLQQEDGTAGGRMNKIFSNATAFVYIWWVYTGVSFFVLGTAVPEVVIGICWGMSRIESASCCYFAPTQTVIEILILILVNQFSYAEKVLLWMPSGIYCNPCHPCAPLMPCGPCRKIGRILCIPHSPQCWEQAVFSTSAFYLRCAVMGQGYG